MKKNKEEQPRRPQWLIYTDGNAAQQAIATDFVSGIFVNAPMEGAAELCIETAGGAKVFMGDMNCQQANQAASHIKYLLAIPQFGRGDVANLNLVVMAAKKAIPSQIVTLA